ncbi:MAG TPA: LysE family translocator [Patescibacteria group bacterium]|nr:LysE family translocator [Patescibacteria group bacterium]
MRILSAGGNLNKDGEHMPIHGAELYSFIAVILLMIISPGANQVLVLQSGLISGHKAAMYNVFGVASSMFIHASLAGLGISIVIMKSPALYGLIKLLGVGYLAYLALSSIYSAYRLRHQFVGNPQEGTVAESKEQSAETALTSFFKGFNTNVMNVQTSFVFLSIFPQYMDFERALLPQSLLLTLIFVGLLLSWYALLITLIFKIRHYLLKPSIQSGIKAGTGVLLLVMATKMFLKT